MKHFFSALVLIVLSGIASADATPVMTAHEWYEQYGQGPGIGGGILAASTPGTLWDNGPFNGINGQSSEADSPVSGTGGPEGDHGSTAADDFVLSGTSELTEIRVCFLTSKQTAELYIYADNSGMPGPAVTSPIFGGPATASVVTSTYNDNTTRCQSALGLLGREFVFNATTTGVTFPTLNAGRYWLAVVGRGAGDQAFWATSSPPEPLFDALWGSTYFGYAYWSSPSVFPPNFAFDIDGRPAGAIAVPAITEWGTIMFIVLSGLGAVSCMRRQGRV